MNKLWLVFKREYMVRVKNKKFILTTLITPLAFGLLFIVPAVIANMGNEDQKQIALVDESGIVIERDSLGKVQSTLKSTDKTNFDVSSKSISEVLKDYEEKGFDGVLHIPKTNNLETDFRVEFYSKEQLSLGAIDNIKRSISRKVERHKARKAGYDEDIMDSFKTKVKVDEMSNEVAADGEIVSEKKQNSAGIATLLGGAMAFVIYIILLVYGGMVMRSVMEEKMNRIVEVIISSVKPFQLMMGKILGVSAVGLTQLLIWIVLIPVVAMVASLFFGVDPDQMQQMNGGMSGMSGMSGMNGMEPEEAMSQAEEIMAGFQAQNWFKIIPLFLIYFLGGYFIYASLFAAVGSAVGDDLGESQSLTFPIMIPVILSIILMGPIIDNPTSSLATWASIFPLFSPILMPARLPFNPPMWEIILSVVLLIATAIFFVWLSARIYRVGILMYGKKVSFKEIGKWLFYKD